MTFDRVLIGADDNPNYITHWPYVSYAWSKLGFRPHLLYITRKPAEQCKNLTRHGDVMPIAPHPVIPAAHMAKLSRLLIASVEPGISLLSDVDMLPLQKEYFVEGAKHYKPGHLLAFSADAYDQEYRYPICYLMADQETFKEIVNPLDLSLEKLLYFWCLLDDKADPSTVPFSDESLLCRLLEQWNQPERIIKLARGWSVCGHARDRIDRDIWDFTEKDLGEHKYIDAHLPRPSWPEHGVGHLLGSVANY